VFFTIYDRGGVPQCFDSGFNLEVGRWYHFAAVVGAGFNTGYLDGVELTGRHYNFGDSSDHYFLADLSGLSVCYLGRGFLASIPTEQFHQGLIDEVRIYDRPLSAAEIAQYYAAVTATWSQSFCDASDGSLATCPCANPGDSDTGCDIAQATGGVRLDVGAQSTAAQNRATLVGTGYPPASMPAAVVIRGSSLDPAAPVAFGDGLRCVGTPLVRLGASFAIAGTSTHTLGHGTAAGSGAFHYQIWFRNQPAMYCTPDAFNLSNGRTLIW
jgi:Concanavalin A-like lectin/glucanases superfamily